MMFFFLLRSIRLHCKLQTTQRKRRANEFTLLELPVVIVIIGLLADLVAPRYFDTVGKSKIKVARAQMDSLEKAMEQYCLDVGNYPPPQQRLEALGVWAPEHLQIDDVAQAAQNVALWPASIRVSCSNGLQLTGHR